MGWNETRTEKLVREAWKEHAGVPYRRTYVWEDEPLEAVNIFLYYPVLSLPMRKVRAALYFTSILLRPTEEARGHVWVAGDDGTRADHIAEIHSCRA